MNILVNFLVKLTAPLWIHLFKIEFTGENVKELVNVKEKKNQNKITKFIIGCNEINHLFY